MPRRHSQKILLFELIRSLIPITLMGKAMLVGVLVWFIDWVLVDGETLFGSRLLKTLVDIGSALAFIPLIYLAIKGSRWLTQHLLWRLRRRLIVTYLLIGALPLLLVLLLILLIGYVLMLQSSANLVSRQLDGYLEQSEAAAMALGRDISNWDITRVEKDQLQRRLQERANALSPIFPDLTLSVTSTDKSNIRLSVRGSSTEGAQNLTVEDNGQLPDWLKDRNQFHGLVVEETPARGRRVHARHMIKLETPTPIIFQLSYPIGANLCVHLKHTTDLEVKPSQVLVKLIMTPSGTRVVREDNSALGNREDIAPWPPGSFPIPIYKDATKWSTGEQGQSDVLLVDLSSLLPWRIWQRVQQFKSESASGNLIVMVIAGLGIFFFLIALLAIISAAFLTRSITGAVHRLYEGTKHVEAGDLNHEIPITGRDQLSDLSVSFNQMIRSIRELLRVSADKQRLDQEMKIAAQVQSRLFPRSVPKTTKLDFAPGICIPARAVSGDYYDFLEVAPGITGIVVADVCGKGVSAALMMANLQANLRGHVQAYHDAYNFKLSMAAQTESQDNPGSHSRSRMAEFQPRSHPVQRIVQRVNQQVVESVIDASYITLFYAEFDEQLSTLHYSNAGHNPPLLLRTKASGFDIERLDRGGTVLGFFDDEYDETELKLHSGDVLVAFTDGLIEAHNLRNEEFGEERLLHNIIRHAHLPAAEIERQILRAIEEWTSEAEQEDDLTLVIFKVR